MIKKRDGFTGEKLISMPITLIEKERAKNSFFNSLFITHIGYFPKATSHYRERRKGCKDNILIYCLDGKGWYHVGGKKYSAKANQFFIIPATDQPLRYGANEKDPWTIYWIHFSGDKLKMLNDYFSIDEFITPRNIHFDEYKIQLWQQIYDCLEKGYSFENISYANMSLYYFLASFLFPDKRKELLNKKSEDISDKVIKYMKKNISERLTVYDIATEFNFSSSHFNSLFRKKTSMSLMDYFIQLKMQRACQLLDFSDMRVKEVAAKIGYDDPYYFSRLFSKVMGLSPQTYRNNLKG